MIDEDTTEARALFTRLMGEEPPMTLTSKTLLRKAHRATRRSATVTGVAATVVAVVGVTMLARSGTAPEPTMALASGEPAPAPEVSFPTVDTPWCIPGAPDCPFVTDDRSNRLSRNVNAAIGSILPKGMTVEPLPRNTDLGQREPFLFGQHDGRYYGSARTSDSAGHGSVSINLGTQSVRGSCDTSPFQLPKNAISVFRPTGCTEQTLKDGTVAVVSTYITRDSTWNLIVVDAKKPDGTTVQLVSNNNTAIKFTGQPATIPTRHDPPLSKDDLLKLVQLPALKY